MLWKWRFDEWSRINRRNGEERGSKMMKNGCKIWRDDTNGDTPVST